LLLDPLELLRRGPAFLFARARFVCGLNRSSRPLPPCWLLILCCSRAIVESSFGADWDNLSQLSWPPPPPPLIIIVPHGLGWFTRYSNNSLLLLPRMLGVHVVVFVRFCGCVCGRAGV
jgi:hypothetical protein